MAFFFPSLGILKGSEPGWVGGGGRKMVNVLSFANSLQYLVVCFKNIPHSKRRKGFSPLLPDLSSFPFYSFRFCRNRPWKKL